MDVFRRLYSRPKKSIVEKVGLYLRYNSCTVVWMVFVFLRIVINLFDSVQNILWRRFDQQFAVTKLARRPPCHKTIERTIKDIFWFIKSDG